LSIKIEDAGQIDAPTSQRTFDEVDNSAKTVSPNADKESASSPSVTTITFSDFAAITTDTCEMGFASDGRCAQPQEAGYNAGNPFTETVVGTDAVTLTESGDSETQTCGPRNDDDMRRLARTFNRAIDLAKVGDFAQAAEVMASVVAEFGGPVNAYGYLAWFLSELGRHEEAIRHSRRANGIGLPSEKMSLIHFQVLWQSGKHVEALDEMRRFLTYRPSNAYTNLMNKWKPDLDEYYDENL
jgi:hypothetical protein